MTKTIYVSPILPPEKNNLLRKIKDSMIVAKTDTIELEFVNDKNLKFYLQCLNEYDIEVTPETNYLNSLIIRKKSVQE